MVIDETRIFCEVYDTFFILTLRPPLQAIRRNKPIRDFLLCRDGVSPAEAASLPASPATTTLKKKGAAANDVRERAAAVRTRRLMKELKEIQRSQESRTDPLFTVSF